VRPAQLLLQHQRLVDRERALRENIENVESRLESDPEVVHLTEAAEEAREAQGKAGERLRESDHAREDHRVRLRSREKELMSGRIRNPTELMQMNEEVQHMKARFALEEDAELQIMEEAEAADEALREAEKELEAAKRRAAEEAPAFRADLEAWQAELAEVEAERDANWALAPKAAQTAFSRVRVRPAVSEVSGTQCTACRVTVTSSGMQTLRKGLDDLVFCENCSRILVLA
jgi:predicted  nucleic acid-binding Zn-ribbon protein